MSTDSATRPLPRVSICIPTYNRPRELSQAIRSVLRQSFRDLEIVVSDDSREGADIAFHFRDDRIRYFQNEKRLGMARNWTRSLDRARGTYLALLMDDDVLYPDFLKSTVPLLESRPRVGLVFTNHVFMSRNQTWPRACAVPGGVYEDPLKLILKHNPVAVSATVMRRSVWESVRPCRDLLTADTHMQILAAVKGWHFYYVDKPLMAYRVHSGQLSREEERFRDDIVQLWDSFTFGRSDAEALRAKQLREALISRAGSRLKKGNIVGARTDVSRALRLGHGSPSIKSIALQMLCRTPWLVGPAQKVYARSIGSGRKLRRAERP